MTNSTDAGDPFTDDLSGEGVLGKILQTRFPYIDMRDVNRPVVVDWFDVIRAIETALASQTPEVEPVALLQQWVDRYAAVPEWSAKRDMQILLDTRAFLASFGQEMDASDAGAGEVVQALVKSRDQFAFYAKEHRAKTTATRVLPLSPDEIAATLRKAETNEAMVIMCAAALATLQPDTKDADLLAWAIRGWKSEVENRPLVNKNRRPLDDVWRQVVRYAGGDDVALLGPAHDDLLARQALAEKP